MRKAKLPCPCGGSSYAECCGRWHGGEAAPTAEALMRSRYSAFALGLADYLLSSWAPATRPTELDLDESPKPKWIGLEVCAHHSNGDEARVEFIARFKVGGRAGRLHETSRFERIDGRWLYVDGIEHRD
ncbi:YchJ family metal-binding protein [Niveibacterium sp. 24ML]|uniref:YchJ family protein n=1 Tax=Niveibacterium sp. 24ML TaxID=2985512 RepID=UPI002270FDA5|nr:YchJ family metal-binding protein [Niveibacterium sp. 24ML]MCX9155286.1 YchJ family metal-binding protein [Niveibacterium sp. 24ML]